ncbi:MAG: glycosyltransferase family 4 protein [Candidatus Rokubacteria bacterium]|nr:glycosyltransferase family 4 protein [Candidatus Rokubacteria bacterium]
MNRMGLGESVKPAVDVLFIEKSFGLSGSTMSLCTLLGHLDAEAYRPHVVVSRREQREYLLRHVGTLKEVALITEARSLKSSSVVEHLVRLVQWRAPRAERVLMWLIAVGDFLVGTIPYAVRLYSWARRRRVVLVHQNNGFDAGALIAARLLGAPMVGFQRGDEWNSFLVRSLAGFVDCYVANSDATRANLLSLHIPQGRVRVVYPPIDFSRFDCDMRRRLRRRDFGIPESSRCFGIVGILVEWKGHGVFLRAARRVFERMPQARAFVVGDTPTEQARYRVELEELARELGITDRVRFIGFREDMPEVLQLLDVVVHASVRAEPFGRVIVEAMAMKKPVVASMAGGPVEIVESGCNGFLVPPGDHDGLADRILELLSDPERARQMGEEAYRRACDRFSVASHMEQIYEVYAALLAPGGRVDAIPSGRAVAREVRRR